MTSMWRCDKAVCVCVLVLAEGVTDNNSDVEITQIAHLLAPY